MLILTTTQAAERLQVHPYTVLNFIRKGVEHNGNVVRLGASRFGRSYRISEASLDIFLELTSKFRQ